MHWNLPHLAVFGIVLFATGCATAPPPAASASTTGALDGTKQIGVYTVTLYSAPARPQRGTNVLEALVVDAAGRPVSDAFVSFDIDMTNMSHGTNVVQAKSSGSGRYSGTVLFMMPGPWRAIVAVSRPGEAAVSARFSFTVGR